MWETHLSILAIQAGTCELKIGDRREAVAIRVIVGMGNQNHSQNSDHPWMKEMDTNQPPLSGTMNTEIQLRLVDCQEFNHTGVNLMEVWLRKVHATKVEPGAHLYHLVMVVYQAELM